MGSTNGRLPKSAEGEEVTDTHAWAEQALRRTIARCVRSLIAELDRKGRAHMRIAAMRVEGREQVELAKSLREDAKRAGLG